MVILLIGRTRTSVPGSARMTTLLRR